MLVVETIAKIRRAYLVQEKPIKEICRDLKVSRKVVCKLIRTNATEFECERRVRPRPKIGPWGGELDRLLAENAKRSSRERLTPMRSGVTRPTGAGAQTRPRRRRSCR